MALGLRRLVALVLFALGAFVAVVWIALLSVFISSYLANPTQYAQPIAETVTILMPVLLGIDAIGAALRMLRSRSIKPFMVIGLLIAVAMIVMLLQLGGL